MSAAARFAVYRLPAIAYMGLIFYVSSGPIWTPLAQRVPDYLLHGAAYAALYVLLFWAVHAGLEVQPGRGGVGLPLALTVLYGLSDEFHQSFVPTREPSAQDFAADATGGLVAMAALLGMSRWISLYRRRSAP
jgi:VanZ family protein